MTRTIDITQVKVTSLKEWNEYCKQNNITPTPIPETILKQLAGEEESELERARR